MTTPKSKIKKVNAIKQKTKVFRQENPVLAVLQWGINHMMSELAYVGEKPLILAKDFKAYSKVQIHNQYYNDEDLPSKFKVKEYCPIVFRSLRERFREEPEYFLYSMCNGPMEGGKSSGKSTSNIFFTHDRRFVVKTLSKLDVASFHNSLAQYYEHIVDHADELLLLPRYYAMYRITVDEKESYLLVSNNILPADLPIHHLYDLKGSTVDRNANDKERSKLLPCLKDNDFTAKHEKVYLSYDTASVLSALERDVAFLARMKLMDYSLLLAVHEINDETPERVVRALAVSHVGAHKCDLLPGQPQKLYFMGIIDALQVYNAKKKAAHAAKTAKHGQKAAISTVKPEQYGKRFLDFIKTSVVSQDPSLIAERSRPRNPSSTDEGADDDADDAEEEDERTTRGLQRPRPDFRSRSQSPQRPTSASGKYKMRGMQSPSSTSHLSAQPREGIMKKPSSPSKKLSSPDGFGMDTSPQRQSRKGSAEALDVTPKRRSQESVNDPSSSFEGLV